MDDTALFEAALAEDPMALRILAERTHEDAALRDRWVAHTRLAIAVRGLAPRPDLAARVLAIVRGRRPSQRRRLARRVVRHVHYQRMVLASTITLAVGIVGLYWQVSGHPKRECEVLPTVAAPPGRTAPTTPTWELGTARVVATAGAIEVTSGTLDLRWMDGSRGQLGPGSAATLGPVTRVERGRLHLDVRPRQASPFRIAAAETEVEVLGTRFTVERDGAVTRVAVSEGRIAVRDRGRSVEVVAGRRLRIDARGMTGERHIWSFAPDVALRLGTWDPASAWIASQPWRSNGTSTLARIEARVDLEWVAHARARARVRSPVATCVDLQVGIAGAANWSQTREVAVGWSTAEWSFADLVPNQPQAPLAARARIDRLALVLNHSEPMEVAWFEILVPEPDPDKSAGARLDRDRVGAFRADR